MLTKKIFTYSLFSVALFTMSFSPVRENSHSPSSYPEFEVPQAHFGERHSGLTESIYQMANKVSLEVEKIHLNEAKATVGDSEGDTTYYPANLFSTLKGFMDPLPDPSNCESASQGSSMIASVNCHLSKDIGVDGIGSYSDNMDGGLFEVDVSDGSADGYDYKVEAWVTFSSKKKFMNYWLDEGGKRGKLEMFPQVPGNNSNTFALSVNWDSRTASNKTLTVIMEQLKDDSSTGWSNRQMAGKLAGARNENTGVMELSGGMNVACSSCQQGSTHDVYKIDMSRDSTYTVAQGEMCDGDNTSGTNASDCSANNNGAFVCFQNSDKVIVDRDASSGSFSNVLDEECSELTDPSGSRIDPIEDNVGLFSDSDDDVFTLDESDS